MLAHPADDLSCDWGVPATPGLVAEVDGRLVGVVWYRLFTEAVHGEGFVDETTPELAITVADGQCRPSKSS